MTLAEGARRATSNPDVTANAFLQISVGQGDLPAIRTALSNVLEEATPPWSVLAGSGPFLETFRSDPEIDRMLFELYGW